MTRLLAVEVRQERSSRENPGRSSQNSPGQVWTDPGGTFSMEAENNLAAG